MIRLTKAELNAVRRGKTVTIYRRKGAAMTELYNRSRGKRIAVEIGTGISGANLSAFAEITTSKRLRGGEYEYCYKVIIVKENNNEV